MKKASIFFLILILVFLASCSKKEPEIIDIFEDGETTAIGTPAPGTTRQPVVVGTFEPVTPPPAGTADPSGGEMIIYGNNVSTMINASVGYMFNGQEGCTLYGAAEYTNNGDCPVIVTSATFNFSVDGQTESVTFSPILGEHDIVMPGETSFVTVFHKYSGTYNQSANVTLSASLAASRTENSRISVDAKYIFLADNYPNVTTLSGVVFNDSPLSCSMNLVYVGFYDQSGKLVGVWYFTKNALLDPGDEKNFAVHMTELRIPGLAALVATTKTHGFGFNS